MEKRKRTKRNGYYYVEGLELPSVTKILGDTLNKPGLSFWIKREAIRMTFKYPDLNEEEIMMKLKIDLEKTQDRGKYIHTLAELMPNVDRSKVDLVYADYFSALISWWETFKPVIIGREVEVYSKTYGYGCRIDHLSKIGDETFLIDVKTGKELYKEVGVQLAAGKQAVEECNMAKVDKTAALLLMNTGEYKFQETKDTLENFLDIFKVWKWMKNKGE